VSTVRAYSCRPVGAEWHVVVFAATSRRARLLGFRSDPGVSEFIEWRARRLPDADGLFASEAAWTHADDAPEWVRTEAAGLWQELDEWLESQP
jgi:hypothetical protein